MTRGSARCLALLIAPLFSSLGCDALTVRSFAGTVSELTLNGAAVTPQGQHLEIWARDQYNDIIRLNPYYDETNALATYGIMIRAAAPLDSPCMIDSKGNLLTSAAAYPTTVVQNGVTQTPEEQALAVVGRLKQLNPASPGPLLAVVPWDETAEPSIPATATPDERLAACNAYAFKSKDPLTYVPNPLQVTAPLHGTVYGFVSFSTTVPPADYDGYRLDMPVSLKGVQEIFFTTEGPTVDPNHRGPLYLVSTLTQGGNEVVHFDLTPPAGSMETVAGTAALYVNLDQAPAANEF
jgi:hypothetical protein